MLLPTAEEAPSTAGLSGTALVAPTDAAVVEVVVVATAVAVVGEGDGWICPFA